MAQHRILVPVDFTPVSTNAMNHAIAVGKALKSELHLLHIVGKKSEFGEAKSRLGAFAERHAAEFDGDMKTTVRIGHLFDDIDDVIPRAEVESFMARYKAAAGFAVETLNAAPRTLPEGATLTPRS